MNKHLKRMRHLKKKGEAHLKKMKDIEKKELRKMKKKSMLIKNISERTILNEENLQEAIEFIKKMSEPTV